MTGMRKLLPSMLRSFEVPTGFPSPDGNDGKVGEDGSVANDGSSASSSLGPAGRPGQGFGNIDLEIERRILALKSRDEAQASLADFKRASPGQFGELKHRLADGVKSAQQVAEQLQRCANMFDPAVQREMRQERVGSFLSWEIILAGVIVVAFPILGTMDFPQWLDPLVELIPEIPDELKPYTGWVSRMVVLNAIAVIGVVAMFINGLKKP